MSDVDLLAALARFVGHELPPQPRRAQSSAEIAAEDAAESRAEDKAFWGRWGGTDADADYACAARENSLNRQREGF